METGTGRDDPARERDRAAAKRALEAAVRDALADDVATSETEVDMRRFDREAGDARDAARESGE